VLAGVVLADAVVVDSAADAVVDPAVVVAASVATGAAVLVDFLSLPHAVARSAREMVPAITSRRLTVFTYVLLVVGILNLRIAVVDVTDGGHGRDRS
jgi:hypothetical protein